MDALIRAEDADQIVRLIERRLEDDVLAVPELVDQLRVCKMKPQILAVICQRLVPAFGKYRGVLDAAEVELRTIFAECLQADGLFGEAADQLSQAEPLTRSAEGSDGAICERLLHIAELYLEAGDSVSAETFIHKAGYKLSAAAAAVPGVVRIRYVLAYARVLDSKMRPLEALHKYLEVLRFPDLAPGDKSTIFQKAVMCATLLGPHRLTAPLRHAMNLELAASADILTPTVHLFASKIIHGECVDDALIQQVATAGTLLAPHHLATTATGKTVFSTALIEHNVRAIAHGSETVSINELAAHLNLAEVELIETVMKMATDKKIAALIDQENGTIRFPAPVVSENDLIRAFCERVEAAEKKVLASLVL